MGLADSQHGLVGRTQLLSLGLGSRAIEHRLASGRLVRLNRAVYAVGVPARTQEARWTSAVLACPPDAVLSHLSAAAAWGLREVDPRAIDVSVPARSGKRRDGIRVHRPRQLDSADTTRHCGVPVTTVPRTLIDIAAVLSTRSLERALDEAEYLGFLTQPELHAALKRNDGRAGAARIRIALRAHVPGTTRTRTPLEERFFLLTRTAGLPQPEVNVKVGPYTVDFLWREAGVAVETDGGASHDRAAQRERDSRRDAYPTTAGYRTQRFTYRQVTERPDEVLATLDALL